MAILLMGYFEIARCSTRSHIPALLLIGCLWHNLRLQRAQNHTLSTVISWPLSSLNPWSSFWKTISTRETNSFPSAIDMTLNCPNKLFDIESPNFTGTFIPIFATVVPDMTSVSTSGRKLLGKTVENAASDGNGWNFSRMVQARIVKYDTLIEDKRHHKSTNLPEMTSLAPSSRLQNAIKCYRKVRKTGLKCRKRHNSEMVRYTAKV